MTQITAGIIVAIVAIPAALLFTGVQALLVFGVVATAVGDARAALRRHRSMRGEIIPISDL